MSFFLIDSEGELKTQKIHSYVLNNIEIFVDGLIYSYGKKAGEETIKWIIEKIINEDEIPYKELCGAFSCVIKQGDKIITFTDNSNMHCIFYSDRFISNRFLKIIECERKAGSKLALEDDSICEYLTTGKICFGKTFFESIHTLGSGKTITVDKKKIIIRDKGIGDIDAKSTVDSLDDFFNKLAYSLSDYRICQALTGGYDSRLIYVCLSKLINDHVAISGNNETSKDVKYASKVAEVNKDTLQIIDTEKPAFTVDLIDQMMLNNDGIEPFDFDAGIRLCGFKSELSAYYNLHLTGDGGVLHKDWEWSQDIPFYRKKKSDSKRFYRQRMYYVDISSHIGEKIWDSFMKQEKRFIVELDKLSKPMNTQSYDSWYYQVSGNRSVYYNNNPCQDLISYAPLMELDIVRYSYALPRFERFFYNSMRNEMSSKNIEVARLKTNYGTTASNEMLYIIHDVLFQVLEYSRKAYRLIGRKVLKRNVLVEKVQNWSMEQDLRNSEFTQKAISYAIDAGYLKPISIRELSYSEIQRIIHIYWIRRWCDNAKNQ